MMPGGGGKILMTKGIQVFGDEVSANVRLNALSLAVGNTKPIEMLGDTGGIETVTNLLTQLEFCVYV